MSENMCNRCGKDLPIKPVPTIFEFGFRKQEVILCQTCAAEVQTTEKNLKEKYKKKLVKLMNEYYRKLLK